MSAAQELVNGPRAATHGKFGATAARAQALKAAMRADPQWRHLSVRHREALSLIATKIARVICGDPEHQDHWLDIAGYAELAAAPDAEPPP